MKFLSYKKTAIASGIALALLLAVGAHAQNNAAESAELKAARADLDRAVQRVAELSRKLGRHEPVLIERRIERKPVLGVILTSDPQKGVHIAGVTPESGAAKAGLRSGDRIVSIDGKTIVGDDGAARAEQARAQLRDLDISNPVTLGYERGGKLASTKVIPQEGERVIVLQDGDAPGALNLGGRMQVMEGPGGEINIDADTIDFVGDEDENGAMRMKVINENVRGEGDHGVRTVVVQRGPGTSPDIHREIIRLRGPGDCHGDDCNLPMLAEAFRWNGLNLASVDAQLGHYFGTDHGVLVLSAPRELGELRAGDVMQKVDGKAVNSPRDAMMALHAREEGSSVAVEYLRDRKRATTQVKVPKAQMWRFPAPPPPPAPPLPPQAYALPVPPSPPPAPPKAHAAPAPRATPAPPAPPAPPVPPEADDVPPPPPPAPGSATLV